MFRRYHRYDELTRWLEDLAAQRPDIFRLESIGQSYQGREIWCMIVTRRETGDHRHKPALWLDGNIHATELAPSAACLHLLFHLMHRDGHDVNVTQVLDSRTFYVVPRANPDGAELALAERPRYLRSSVRYYPHEEDPVTGMTVEDVDGDGRILSMRMRDPNGAWKCAPEDPRLMVRREPQDLEGPFYRVMPEGRHLGEYDGAILAPAHPPEGLDLNRNFPAFWRPEAEQVGAGPYPVSEPEVRCLVDFITQHPNICHAISYHTYGGVLLRPYSTDPDEHFPAEDLWLYRYLGDKGTEFTGYPNVSVYHDFRYHPNEVITGGFDEWAYDHLGVFGWTVEIWSALRQAGITEGLSPETPPGKFRFIDWNRIHPVEEDLALLRWSDEQLEGNGYLDWRPFVHPELGEVELGGWDLFYSFRNPPPQFLEKEIKPLAEWLVWQAQTTPRLAVFRHKVTPLGHGRHALELVLENRGWLPTYVTKKALQRKLRPIMVELELPEGAELEVGQLRTEAGHLEGKAYKPSAVTRHNSDPTDDRVKLQWVVRAPSGGEVKVRAYQDRAGHLTRSLQLSNS